ncbi:glycoside hydrolase [Vulgatibacter sp.]|uniref:glycoside hydrolase n=1 Tax=Vulgatibacter sp. TaxID=1971226 RepID=UPI00356B3A7C
MSRIELAFLWHMHQPPYRDPESGAYILPWVRLHATRAYLDMAAIHERFPGVRSTVNFVPSLLAQLEDYAAGTARDRFLDLTARSAADLVDAERVFLLRNFFMVSWEQGVRPLPRYWEILHKRGTDLSRVDLDRVARSFTVGEIRDLQVLFNLAWMGFAARESNDTVKALVRKGRDFTEEEKHALLEAQRQIVGSIIPTWKKLQEQGSVELTATPYYHPILPLLCDTDAAQIALPHHPMPPRMRATDDAREQVARGLEKFEQVFGKRPEGMWPAEGSVSPEALEVFATEGVKWVATDEEVLFRSLPAGTDRRRALYRPWSARAGDGEIAMVFRDHGLSDLLGFTYARSPARDAVNDFLGHLGRIAHGAPWEGGEPPLCSVILDGENPWEHYPQSGHLFLTELFSRLEKEEGGVRTTTIGARVARGVPPGRIEKIWSGSWIEASYRIWIGHEEDVTAWTLVGEARKALETAATEGVEAERIAAAREHLLAAEASDWYWWYGEDFVTESASEFDGLFRGHIQAVFRILGLPPPPRVLQPIAAGVRPSAAEATPAKEPTGFIHPTIDGEAESWREWLGAGLFRAEQARGGAMHQNVGTFGALYYGFDAEHLYLRLDPVEEGADFTERLDGLRISLQREDEVIELRAELKDEDIRLHHGHGGAIGGGRMRVIVELAIPFAAVGLHAGQRAGVSVRGMRGEVEAERIPSQGWLSFDVPDEHFERVHWKV